MDIRIDKHIQELLYENHSVNIPGLGGLVTDYQAAQVDHVQSKILPPARAVSLNTNLHTNDGLLTQRIADAQQISGLEAEQIIRDYVEQLHEKLDSGEIATIEGVGRVYRNLQGSLYLMTDHTNFDTTTYGLPEVGTTIVNRVATEHSKTISSATRTNTQEQEAKPTMVVVSDWFQQNLWFVISAAMLIFVLSLWLLFFKNSSADPNSGLTEVKELPEDRINVSPGEIEDDEVLMGEDPDAENQDGNSQIADEDPISPATNTAEEESDLNTEAPTLAPEQAVALIRIGIFGDRENVQRLVQRIYDEGFEPFTREKGKLIEVGVQFAYDDEEEIRANLRAIRKKFEKKAKVVR